MIPKKPLSTEWRGQTVFMTRFLRAPRNLVFEALVEPEHLARWCVPSDFMQSVCEVELWRGGAHRSVLRGLHGNELTLSGVYLEVRPPESLVYTERFELGTHSNHEHVVSIMLGERSGGTTLTLTEGLLAAKECSGRVRGGAWETNLQSLERLVEYVESMSTAEQDDDPRRESALMPFECDDRAETPHRPSGMYTRAGLGTHNLSEEAPLDRSAGRLRALARFAALFISRQGSTL